MPSLFASGHIADGILVFMLGELIVLILVRKKFLKRLKPYPFIISLAAGAALLLALRAALRGLAWPSIALWLLLALIAHLWDLKLRWAAP